jgi:hypothetical protein
MGKVADAERRGPAARRIGQLRAFEFALLYVGLPLGIALALPADWLWLVFFAATALAHLMFWNWVAVGLTFGGGAIFARAYLGRGGFALAVVLHAVAGAILFTSGLGGFFYHGRDRELRRCGLRSSLRSDGRLREGCPLPRPPRPKPA